MQSKLDVLMARVNEAEEWISELEDGMVEEKAKTESWLKRIQSQECRLWEITDSMKHSNVRIISISEGVEKNRGLEEIFEQIVAENFPNIAKETNIHHQEAERTSPKLNHDKPTTCQVIVQFTNIRSKDRVLKVARGKKILTYRGKISEEHQTCLQRPGRPGRVGRVLSQLYVRRSCSQGSLIQQGCHSELMER